MAKLNHSLRVRERSRFPEWIPILNNFAAYGVRNPSELALLPRADVALLANDSSVATAIWEIWRFASLDSEQIKSLQTDLSYAYNSNAESLASSFRAKDIDSTSFSRRHKAARLELGLNEDFDRAGPADRIRFLEWARSSPDAINAFLNTGAQINTLRQVQGSLRCVAAGVQCWASYCDLVGDPYFPPTSSRVLRWGALFKPGRTFGGYVAHLVKECQLLNITPTWYNSAVRGFIHGLENAQDVSSKFENYTGKRLFRKMVAHETPNSEFGRLFYLDYVCILRLPSEALPVIRASPTEALTQRPPTAFRPSSAYWGSLPLG